MERRVVNPWTWQDNFGFVQANEISNPQRTLLCAGQASVDADGHPVHVGDMGGQLTMALDNLETVLGAAGFGLGDVMRITVYTTDVDGILAVFGSAAERMAAAGCRPAMTLLGVTRLAFPELLVELEATAMK